MTNRGMSKAVLIPFASELDNVGLLEKVKREVWMERSVRPDLCCATCIRRKSYLRSLPLLTPFRLEAVKKAIAGEFKHLSHFQKQVFYLYLYYGLLKQPKIFFEEKKDFKLFQEIRRKHLHVLTLWKEHREVETEGSYATKN